MNDTELIRASINEPFDQEVRAEAVALVWATGSFSAAARTLREKMGERSPSRQLITRWCAQDDPERVAAIAQERKDAFVSTVMETSLRSAEKLHEIVDSTEGPAGAIPAGIGIDKGLRLLELDKRNRADSNLGIFVFAFDKKPEEVTVEGHVLNYDE